MKTELSWIQWNKISGLSEDIKCHVWPYCIPCLQIAKSDIRQQIIWAVSLVIWDVHFNLPQGFVWVHMANQSWPILANSQKKSHISQLPWQHMLDQAFVHTMYEGIMQLLFIQSFMFLQCIVTIFFEQPWKYFAEGNRCHAPVIGNMDVGRRPPSPLTEDPSDDGRGQGMFRSTKWRTLWYDCT